MASTVFSRCASVAISSESACIICKTPYVRYRTILRTLLLLAFIHLTKYPKIFAYFPSGGASGTIRSWYKSDDEHPYVYAKTGTLSGVHCLSGYLLTKSGKTLHFSFMHNNYVISSSELKKEMEKVLYLIYDQY